MPGHSDSDEMIDRLVAAELSDATPELDSSVADLRAQFETIESRARRPKPPDPFVDEPQCRHAVERVLELGRELSSSAGADAAEFQADDSESIEMLGQYQLREKLGEGGMGAVYKAVHTRLERVVALKILPKDRLQDSQAVARFQREMRAVGKLQHPNIVAAHDAGEIDGTHYLVMELVDGIDLAKLVSREGPLQINSACELIRQAALGLQHAYQHNLVHRDIKPSNLMLAAPVDADASPVVKVLDLGLALLEPGQIDAGELTTTGQVMGTIDYMAPEQGNDTHGVDIRADIYSLGASLYKLLTGRTPFADVQLPMKKLMALANQVPKDVACLRPDCPPELSQLIARMLAKSPDERPAAPIDVARSLEPFSRGVDLRALLRPGESAQKPTVRGDERTVRTHATADDPTFIPGRAHRQSPVKSTGVLIAGGGGVIGCLLLAAAIVFWQTRNGSVRIQINDPQIRLTIDGHQATLTSVDMAPIRLVPGEHGIAITRGDFKFSTTGLQVKKGAETTLEIEWIEGKQLKVLQDGVLIGARELPAKFNPQPTETAANSANNSALEFDAGVEGCRAVLPVPFEGDGDLTVEAWITPFKFHRYATVIASPDVTIRLTTLMMNLERWSVSGSFRVRNEQGQEGHLAKYNLNQLTLRVPVHVALVRRNGAMRMYLNGSGKDTTAAWGDYPDLRKLFGVRTPVKVDEWSVGRIGGHAFTGRIDEIRISGVARYDSDFTPQQRFEPDASTLGLYHFDEGDGDVVHDASGHERHGKVFKAKWVRTSEPVPEAVPHALEFDGTRGSRVEIAGLGWDGTPSLTIEARVTSPLTSKAPMIIARIEREAFAQIYVGHTRQPPIRPRWIGVVDQAGQSVEVGRVPGSIPADSVQHLAYVVDRDAVRLFENGKVVSERAHQIQRFTGGETQMTSLGAQWNYTGKPWLFPFTGRLYEVRISKTPRYRESFTPAARLESDADTLALYRFDEGAGDVLHDGSGNGHHGKIVGATWVKIDPPPESQKTASEALQPTDRRLLDVFHQGVDRAAAMSDEDQRQLREQIAVYWDAHRQSGDQIESARLMRKLDWPADRPRANIPAEELAYVGRDPGKGAPQELVAIYGSGRLRHWRGVRAIRFSPDSKWLASPSVDGTIWIWNALTGEPVQRLQAFDTNYEAVAFTADGKSVIAAAGGGWFHRWDVEGWKLRATVEPQGGSQSAHWDRTWLALSSQGAFSLCAARGNQAVIRDAATGKVLQTLKGHDAPVTSVALSRDDRIAVTGDEAGTAFIWEVATGKDLGKITPGQGEITAVTLTDDGSLVALGHLRGTLSFVETADPQSIRTVNKLGPLVSLDFSSDGKKLLVGGGGVPRGISELDVRSGEILRAIDRDSYWCQFVRYSPDQASIACGYLDGKVAIWDAATGAARYDADGLHSDVGAVAASPDGVHLVATTSGDELRHWKINGSETAQKLKLGSLAHSIRFLDSRRLFVASTASGNYRIGTAGIWDIDTDERIKSIALTHGGYDAPPPVLSPDSGSVACVDTLKSVSIRGFSGTTRVLCHKDTPIKALQISPDGQQVALAVADSVQLHNWQTGALEQTLSVPGVHGQTLAYSREGSVLLCGTSDWKIHAWELPSGRELSVHTGHEQMTYPIARIVWSPDGTQFASCSGDGTVRIWTLESPAPIRTILIGPPHGTVRDLAWLPDGRHLAVANQNTTVMLLRLESR